MVFSSEKALKDVEQALKLHLICYTRNFESGTTKIDKSEEYARNTAYFFFDFLVLHARTDEFFATVNDLFETANIRLDPIEAPFIRALDLLVRDKSTRAEAAKKRNKLESAKRALEAKSSWYDTSAKSRLVGQINKIVGALNDPAAFARAKST
jgi:hypothetical protein